MDVLEIYLTSHSIYNIDEIRKILETKIIITNKHVEKLNIYCFKCYDVIKLFEQYGYI